EGSRVGPPQDQGPGVVVERLRAALPPRLERARARLLASAAEGRRDRRLADEGLDDAILLLLAPADEQRVAAGGHGLDGGVFDRLARGDRVHFQVVAREDATEPDGLA